MDGFVYRWTNNLNDKWYIGSHKGTTDDGYRYSSEIMAFAEKKHGADNFTREILFEGQGFRRIEAEYLNKHDAAHNPQSYNRTNITGPECDSEETTRKRSLAQMGKIKSEDHCRKLSEANKGKKQSAETRKKNSEAHTGSNNPMWGRTHSEETLQKMRDAKKNYVPWNKGKKLAKTKE